MSFTRYKYDDCRTIKYLEESTGPGRYILNKPGNGPSPIFINDPQIRVQEWGANLRNVRNGHPIDIDSDLSNRTRKLTKYCTNDKFPNSGVTNSSFVHYPSTNNPITDQTRTTHPAWMYRGITKDRSIPLFVDPQENVCLHFHNNLNTRLLERDNFVPKAPCFPNLK